MSADIGWVTILRFSSGTKEQKEVLQETVTFCVLQIKWLAANDIPFSSSKTTCSISATRCWVLKLKGTPLMKDSLRFKAHTKLDGSTGLVNNCIRFANTMNNTTITSSFNNDNSNIAR